MDIVDNPYIVLKNGIATIKDEKGEVLGYLELSPTHFTMCNMLGEPMLHMQRYMVTLIKKFVENIEHG